MYAEVFSYETRLEKEGLINRTTTEHSAMSKKKKSFFLPASVFPRDFLRYLFIIANLVVPNL